MRSFGLRALVALALVISPGHAQSPAPIAAEEPPHAAAERPANPQERKPAPPLFGRAAFFVNALGARLHSYDVVGSDADGRTVGALFAIDPDITYTVGPLTGRSTAVLAIGGGSDGLEGQLEWAARLGARAYLGEDHGPFGRVGFALQLAGNNKFYRSQVELPAGEVGYQLFNDDIFFELAATGSLVLGGRFFLGDAAERQIDTEPALGGLATLQVHRLRFHGTAQRVFASQTGPGTAIDQFQAQLCVLPFDPFMVCGHGGYHQGAVELPGVGFRDAHATYLGMTVAAGAIANSGKNPRAAKPAGAPKR